MGDQEHDKYSIKNLLFYRAIPNYTAAVASEHANKLHSCLDCGDRFVMESSLLNHVNRKSMKITYKCHSCSYAPRKVFYNRCHLLSHIRSHSLQTVTINIADLTIDPLPSSFFYTLKQKTQARPEVTASALTCVDCNSKISDSISSSEDRIDKMLHYMKLTNRVHLCPVCLLSLPTVCALKAHIRIHLKISPYICPECGLSLSAQSIRYPYNHNCEGFKMMRATTRVKCPVEGCNIFHPNDFNKHLMTEHMKKVYKCPSCDVACFSESTILKHITKNHIHLISKVIIFYQCELCPGRLVVQNLMDRHLRSHITDHVYPCWTCAIIFHDVPTLIDHHLERHSHNDEIKQTYISVRNSDSSKTYRVVKRCDQCKKNFSYKCKYLEINTLPNVCPNKCCGKSAVEDSSNNTNPQIMCAICKAKINDDWEDIKIHYASCHKNYKCLDIKVALVKMDLKKYLSKYKKHGRRCRKPKRKSMKDTCLQKVKKPTTENVSVNKNNSKRTHLCNICQYSSKEEEEFQLHIKEHRDPCSAYQCMECGQCFVVKPSFSTHLLMEHEISNVDDYIIKKQCYNDSALSMKFHDDSELNLPLNDHQCKICREQYNNANDLEKHFRVHGMAFLKKNQNKSNVS